MTNTAVDANMLQDLASLYYIIALVVHKGCNILAVRWFRRIILVSCVCFLFVFCLWDLLGTPLHFKYCMTDKVRKPQFKHFSMKWHSQLSFWKSFPWHFTLKCWALYFSISVQALLTPSPASALSDSKSVICIMTVLLFP